MFDLAEYLEGVASKEVALRIVGHIYDSVNLLEDQPFLGRPAEMRGRREFVVGEHVVTYQVKRGAVRVLKVEHGRQRK
jgi:plasmid stabilization system protein ParE